MIMARTFIRTYKIKATETRGEGVRARVSDGTSSSLAWDYARDTLGMHMEAAKHAVGGQAVNWTGEYTPTGYVFVVAD